MTIIRGRYLSKVLGHGKPTRKMVIQHTHSSDFPNLDGLEWMSRREAQETPKDFLESRREALEDWLQERRSVKRYRVVKLSDSASLPLLRAEEYK
jgi:hypothetical protein